MYAILVICSLLASSSTATFKPLQHDAAQFSAVVGKNEGVFTLLIQPKKSWSWRLPETGDNKQEYRMDVTVRNPDKDYTFGFYLWKRAGARAGSGSLNDLISTGQKSLFERTEPRRMTIVRDAQVKVKVKGNQLVISLHGHDHLKRLFSSRPVEAIFKIKFPDEPEITQTVPIVYQE
jgi:hypothetical protein